MRALLALLAVLLCACPAGADVPLFDMPIRPNRYPIRGLPDVINVLDFGAIPDATGTGGTDNCSVFAAAVARVPAAGGVVYFPPGRYVTSCPIPLKSNIRYYGASINGTTIQTVPNGTGVGYALFQVSTPRTCTGGTGACDSAMGGAGRGAACVCYTNADCQSSTCTGGTAARDTRIDHLKLIVYENNSMGIDFGLVSEGAIQDAYVVASGTPPNAIGVFFSDGGGLVAGYSDTLITSNIENFQGTSAACVRIGDRANDTRIISSMIETNCRVGLQIDPNVNATHVIGNLFQAPISGGTNLLDNGVNSLIDNNRFEGSGGTHINFGATSVSSFVSKSRFSGSSTKYVNSGAATPHIENSLAASAPPVACDAAHTGATYYDIDIDETCVCNGSAYTQQDGGGTTGCS